MRLKEIQYTNISLNYPGRKKGDHCDNPYENQRENKSRYIKCISFILQNLLEWYPSAEFLVLSE